MAQAPAEVSASFSSSQWTINNEPCMPQVTYLKGKGCRGISSSPQTARMQATPPEDEHHISHSDMDGATPCHAQTEGLALKRQMALDIEFTSSIT
jgi:hypothetical protein